MYNQRFLGISGCGRCENAKNFSLNFSISVWLGNAIDKEQHSIFEEQSV